MSDIAKMMIEELLGGCTELINTNGLNEIQCLHDQKLKVVTLKKANSLDGDTRWIGMCSCGKGYYHK